MEYNDIKTFLYNEIPEDEEKAKQADEKLQSFLTTDDYQPLEAYPEILPFEDTPDFIIKRSVGKTGRFISTIVKCREEGIFTRSMVSAGVSSSSASDFLVGSRRYENWVGLTCPGGYVAFFNPEGRAKVGQIHTFLTVEELYEFCSADEEEREAILQKQLIQKNMDEDVLAELRLKQEFSNAVPPDGIQHKGVSHVIDNTGILHVKYMSANKIIYLVITYDKDKMKVSPYFAGEFTADELEVITHPIIFKKGQDISGTECSCYGLDAGYFSISWDYDGKFSKFESHTELIDMMCSVLPHFDQVVDRALAGYGDKVRGKSDLNMGMLESMKKNRRSIARKVTVDNALTNSQYSEIFWNS